MNTQTITNTINGHFKTKFADIYGIKTIYDNDPTDPPDKQSWVRLHIAISNQTLASFGADREYRQTGVMFVNVFTLPDTGQSEARVIVDNITDIFRGAKVSGIIFRPPRTNELGNVDGWYQISVAFSFQIDDTGSGESTPDYVRGVIDRTIQLTSSHEQLDGSYEIQIVHGKGRPVLSAVINTETGIEHMVAKSHPNDNTVAFGFIDGTSLLNKNIRFILF